MQGNAIDHRHLPPLPIEDALQYALRLQDAGYDEIFVRKALRFHFQTKIEELAAFCEPLRNARLRSVRLYVNLHLGRTEHYLIRRVSRSLGIDEQLARDLVREVMSDPQE